MFQRDPAMWRGSCTIHAVARTLEFGHPAWSIALHLSASITEMVPVAPDPEFTTYTVCVRWLTAIASGDAPTPTVGVRHPATEPACNCAC